MLLSAVQQSDLVIHIYTFFFKLFSTVFLSQDFEYSSLCYRTLFFIHPICTSLHLLIPNSHSIHSPAPFPLGNHESILWLWICFKDKFVCVMLQVLHVSDIIGCLSFSFWLTSLSMIISRSVHIAANGNASFLRLNSIPSYVCITSSLSTHLLMDIKLLSHLGYCEQCCYEHRSSCIFLNYTFAWIYS